MKKSEMAGRSASTLYSLLIHHSHFSFRERAIGSRSFSFLECPFSHSKNSSIFTPRSHSHSRVEYFTHPSTHPPITYPPHTHSIPNNFPNKNPQLEKTPSQLKVVVAFSRKNTNGQEEEKQPLYASSPSCAGIGRYIVQERDFYPKENENENVESGYYKRDVVVNFITVVS